MPSTITFNLKAPPALTLEVEMITPDTLAGKPVDAIKAMEAWEAKDKKTLGDYFDISGEAGATPAETRIVIQNSTMRVRRIGEAMSAGEIEVIGDAGTHLGDSMKGGKITVKGNVDNYCGCEMKGGEIHVTGNAGDYLGSAYRGNWRGMSGGKIVIDGDAGFEIGAWIRGTKKTRDAGQPLIHVKGNVGLHAGHHNHGGFVVIGGNAPGRAGSEMARGDVVVMGKTDVLASFSKDDGETASIPEIGVDGPFITYSGDNGIAGKGKLYLKK